MSTWIPAVLTVLAATHLVAADPVWKIKPAPEWTDDEARQVLTASPWVKEVRATITRRLTEDELREAGQMGQPQGLGNEGVDAKGTGPKVSANVFTGPGGDDHGLRAMSQFLRLRLRWESALPIRLAELKSHEVEPPTLDGEGYRIAVYGVPGPDFKGGPRELGEPLKKEAFLRREGQKDVKPVSCEVFRGEDGWIVVYLFPYSAELTKKDHFVQFEAHIGRIVVAHAFDLSQMEYMGKLEL